MKQNILGSDSGWYCEFVLEPHEWKKTDWFTDDTWLDRPIYLWVYNHCQNGVFFSCVGRVLFEKIEDAVMFKMVWG